MFESRFTSSTSLHGVILIINSVLQACWSRFFPACVKLRECIEKKAYLGDIKLVTAQFGLNIGHLDRLKNLSMGGGSLMDLGIYNIQFVMMVYGNEMPEEIVTSVVKNHDGKKTKPFYSCHAVLLIEAP